MYWLHWDWYCGSTTSFSIFKDITAITTANTPPLLPLLSFVNYHLPPAQHTLQMWWHLNAPSHHGFPPLGPSPWRWELGPWIQSLGNQQHQQQEQQCPVSTMQEHQRDRERWRPVAARKFALWREDITNFITSHIQKLSTAHSTSEVLCALMMVEFHLWVQWSKFT